MPIASNIGSSGSSSKSFRKLTQITGVKKGARPERDAAQLEGSSPDQSPWPGSPQIWPAP